MQHSYTSSCKSLGNAAKFVLASLVSTFLSPVIGTSQIMYPGPASGTGTAAGELVWRWAADSCSFENIPDAPIRAYRDSSDQIVLTIPHIVNYRLKGADFSSLARDCSPMFDSEHLTNPSLHRSAQWIQSLYTEDGKQVHAILHNENFDAGGYGTGLYYSTSAAYAVSSNGGASFTEPAFPNNVIFSPSSNATARSFAPLGHEGLQPYSNIIKRNGYYYVYGYITLADHTLMTPANTPLYLFRNDDLSNVQGWRGYDGNDFTVALGNAYTESLDLSQMRAVGEGTLWEGGVTQLGSNITWNTYFNKYMMVGISSKGGLYGIYYSLSEDLLNWSIRVPLKIFGSNYQMGLDIVPNPSKITVTYPSIIDHDDTSRNFEVSDQTVYLYWVENDPSTYGTSYFAYSRSIKRQALTLSKTMVSEFVVNSVLDIDDVNNGDALARGQNGGNFVNTLRAALTESRLRPPYAVNDTLRIRFSLPSGNPVIQLSEDLGWTHRVGIDGSSQSGAQLNSSFLPNGMNLDPKVTIQGGLLPLKHPLSYIKNIRADQVYMYGDSQDLSHSVIQDLQLDAKHITAGGIGRSNQFGKVSLLSDSCRVSHNFIGVNADGTGSIAIDSDPLVRLFGSDNELDNNLISGANNQAIQIEPDAQNGRLASKNILRNNFIGTNADQTAQGFIQNDAIELKNGAEGNKIEDNLITGAQNGIYVSDANNNSILRNVIGSDENGILNGNRGAGIWITGASTGNLLGSTNPNDRNIVYQNGQFGIDFLNLTGTGNTALGNRIYTNWAGSIVNPGEHQPQALQVFSAWVNVTNDSVFVSCLEDTFSMLGNYRVEVFQTLNTIQVNDAETMIAFTETDAAGLSNLALPINAFSYDNGLPYLTVLLHDPQGNTSVLSTAVEILTPATSPIASIDDNQLSSSLDIESINIEVSNTGNSTLNWSIPNQNDWTIIEPNSGSINAGESAFVTITLYRGDLCGALIDTIYLNSNEVNGTPLPIEVQMAALPQAGITYTGSLSFCPGGNILLRGTPGNDFTYRWFKDGILMPTETLPNYLANSAGEYSVEITHGVCVDTSNAVTVSLGGNLTAEITVNGAPSICGGQPVVLQASSGVGYTYQWLVNNNPIGGANQSQYNANAPGNYTVRITGNGCTVTSPGQFIGMGAAPQANINANGPTTFCEGGFVNLNANTGANLQYQWMRNGVDIQNANQAGYQANQTGNYQVRVSQNGCSSISIQLSITVTAAPVATISANGATTFCEGGSVSLSATSGAGYSYEWMLNGNIIPSASASSYTATTAGDYSVRVIAAGCSDESSTLSVQVNNAPVATISANGATTFCEGGSVNLSANTGAGLIYSWLLNGNEILNESSASLEVIASGTYAVLVDNGSCAAASEGIEVVANAIPDAPVLQISGNNIQASVSEGIVWMLNDEIIEGATGDTVEIFQQGIYTATVSVNGCTSQVSNEVEITALALVSNDSLGVKMDVFPNPSQGNVFLSTNLGGKADLILLSSEGKCLRSFTIPAIEAHQGFDFNDLPAGIYFLSGSCESRQIHLRFVILD